MIMKQYLAKELEIKELGKLNCFLRIEIAHSTQESSYHSKYINDLQKNTGKLACKLANTPIDPYHKLELAEEDIEVDKGMYQRLLGRLIYLLHTRLVIAYAVSVINQFMHNHKNVHLQAAYKVLFYLKVTLGKGIMFKKNDRLQLQTYTDANYAGPMVGRRSTIIYCTFLRVTWSIRGEKSIMQL